MIYNTLHRKQKIEQHDPDYTGGELEYSGGVSSFSSTFDTHRVTLVTNPVISHK